MSESPQRPEPALPIEAPGELLLYGAPHCQPCMQAKAALSAIAQGTGLAWSWVDLTESPKARKIYGQRIPVLCLGERVLGEGRLDAAALRSILLREALLGSSLGR